MFTHYFPWWYNMLPLVLLVKASFSRSLIHRGLTKQIAPHIWFDRFFSPDALTDTSPKGFVSNQGLYVLGKCVNHKTMEPQSYLWHFQYNSHIFRKHGFGQLNIGSCDISSLYRHVSTRKIWKKRTRNKHVGVTEWSQHDFGSLTLLRFSKISIQHM